MQDALGRVISFVIVQAHQILFGQIADKFCFFPLKMVIILHILGLEIPILLTNGSYGLKYRFFLFLEVPYSRLKQPPSPQFFSGPPFSRVGHICQLKTALKGGPIQNLGGHSRHDPRVRYILSKYYLRLNMVIPGPNSNSSVSTLFTFGEYHFSEELSYSVKV